MSTMSGRLRRSFATPTALLLTLLLVGQASAAGWGTPVTLSSSTPAEAGGLVALSKSVVVVTYEDGGAVFVRRSTDSGLSWLPSQQIAAVGSDPEIAGQGHTVDLVWATGTAVRYVQSTDSGVSFGPEKTLASRSAGGLGSPYVARGPDNVVAVAWNREGIARARVSLDGGQSFGPPATVDDRIHGVVTAIAIGTHVVYVATAGLIFGCGGNCAAEAFGIWRSIDGGVSWDASMFKGESSSISSIAAIGHRAFAGAAYSPRWSINYLAMYFKTTDRGSTWSGPKTIASDYDDIGGPVIVSVQNERLRAVWTYTNYLQGGPIQLAYRERDLQQPWSPIKILSDVENPRAAGVGFSGHAVVLFTEYDNSGTDCCSVVRAIARNP